MQVRAGAKVLAFLLSANPSYGPSHERTTIGPCVNRSASYEMVCGRRGSSWKTTRTRASWSRSADAALRDLIDQQAPERSDGVGATLCQLLDRWLEECERLDLFLTTLRMYRARITKAIRPRLGKVKLNQLTAKHLDDLCGFMNDAGKLSKAIRDHRAIISSALHQGVR